MRPGQRRCSVLPEAVQHCLVERVEAGEVSSIRTLAGQVGEGKITEPEKVLEAPTPEVRSRSGRINIMVGLSSTDGLDPFPGSNLPANLPQPRSLLA